MREFKVGLLGVPNAGKTTLFNILTGGSGHVGNWPGVTVDVLEGILIHKGTRFRIFDLPGCYSLNPSSEDEAIVPRIIMSGDLDLIVIVLDGSNPRSSMYLAVQLLESDIPAIVVLNKADRMMSSDGVAEPAALSRVLDCPVVPVVSTKGIGTTDLKDSLIHEAHHHLRSDVDHPHMHERFEHDPRDDGRTDRHSHKDPSLHLLKRKPLGLVYGPEIEPLLKDVQKAIGATGRTASDIPHDDRFIAIRFLEGDPSAGSYLDGIEGSRSERLRRRIRDDYQLMMIDARYSFIDGMFGHPSSPGKGRLSNRFDRIVTNRYLGLPIFLFLLSMVFSLTYLIGFPLSDAAGKVFEWLADTVSDTGDGWFVSMVSEGLIPGVGSVAMFSPMIFLLFFAISVLEHSGYMARGAFVVDGVMSRLGLPGRAFIPLVMGFGCNVPGIMAARTIPNYRDRIATILLVPFMTCSARLPVLMLLSSVFFGPFAGLVVVSMYMIGILGLIISSVIIARFLMKGEPSPLLMEMPPYAIPDMKAALKDGSRNTWSFLRKAGTIILVAMIVVWGMTNVYVHDGKLLVGHEEGDGIGTNESLAAWTGKGIEPLFRPLGFDWKVIVSLLMGVIAKEIVVGSLEVLSGAEEDGPDENLGTSFGLDEGKAFALMVFLTLYTPCIPALATIVKETGRRSWAVFSALYNLVFAYGAAFAVTAVVHLISVFGG